MTEEGVAHGIEATWDQLKALASEARETAIRAIDDAERSRLDDVRVLGERVRREQDRLFDELLASLPGAVRRAAMEGSMHAVLAKFDGTEKYDEFCKLYLIKGPRDRQERQELREMNVVPLLYRLQRMVKDTGFAVKHVWQTSTNLNTLTVMW